MAPAPIRLNASVVVDGVSPQTLWPLVSDTDRVNRLVGLPASERVTPAPDLTRLIHGHFYGVPVTWREQPFEWVFEHWHAIERLLDPPLPIGRLTTFTRLTPIEGNRSRVDVEVRLEPRNLLGQIGAYFIIGRKMLRDLVRVYRMLGAAAARFDPMPPPPRPPKLEGARLAEGLARLRQLRLDPELVERLGAHLARAADQDVLHMRPFALADAWGKPRLDVLRLFLHATRAGLLDLEWDVMCPNCRGASARVGRLSDLSAEAHCPSCNIRYDLNFEESVELRFSISADLRTAEDVSYCVGGPGNTRHILAQIWLPPGARKSVRLRLQDGDYRVRSRQLAGRATLAVALGGTARVAHIRCDEEGFVAPTEPLAEGEVELVFTNETGQGRLAIFEQSAWSLQAASAALVTALPEFRNVFSSEVLTPGLGLAVRNLTFLFSDLKSSTMIYDSLGDAPAYARVRDHFDVIRAIVEGRQGSLVKTIGDAVMVVFPSVVDAFEAAVEIQHAFTNGEIARGRPALRLKIGLHRGPCIAVNANDLLDYFGSTVNIAARVQNESVGGDIVVTPEVYDDVGVRSALDREDVRVETFRRALRGVSREFALYRLWVPSSVAQEARHASVSAGRSANTASG